MTIHKLLATIWLNLYCDNSKCRCKKCPKTMSVPPQVLMTTTGACTAAFWSRTPCSASRVAIFSANSVNLRNVRKARIKSVPAASKYFLKRATLPYSIKYPYSAKSVTWCTSTATESPTSPKNVPASSWSVIAENVLTCQKCDITWTNIVKKYYARITSPMKCAKHAYWTTWKPWSSCMFLMRRPKCLRILER